MWAGVPAACFCFALSTPCDLASAAALGSFFREAGAQHCPADCLEVSLLNESSCCAGCMHVTLWGQLLEQGKNTLEQSKNTQEASCVLLLSSSCQQRLEARSLAMQMRGDEAPVHISEATRKKAEAAKSYIENMYKLQHQNIQDRLERCDLTLVCQCTFASKCLWVRDWLSTQPRQTNLARSG